MKRNDIALLASRKDNEIRLCEVTEHSDKGITFIVDEGLSKPKYHLCQQDGKEVVVDMLRNKQIQSNEVFDIVKCSFAKDKFATIGSDTLYKCIIQCFAEHRPLVISPDVIWLLISQTLTNHIFDHAEEYREKIVNHEGKLELEVKSKYDIKDKRLNWSELLDGFYDKIAQNTKNHIAKKLVSDFTTTSIDDRICSIATLMHGVEAYFTYTVTHMICGIPYITLQGTEKDWKNLYKKASILKEYGLSYWYKWLSPILREFIRTASGKPQLDFWKSIVQIAHDKDFSTGRGCCPDYHDVDGWCVALFPHVSWKTGRMCYDTCLNTQKMKPETIRVGFKYKEKYPDGTEITTPMELWCGIVGVNEDKKTYALTPKVGWFVRKSHEYEESLNRLKEANKSYGIELNLTEVPEILNDLDSIEKLTLTFKNKIALPEWIFNKSIKQLSLYGNIDDEYRAYLKKKFNKVCINEDPWDVFHDDDVNDAEAEEIKEDSMYGSVGGITQIGLFHNLPVYDMKATAAELSRIFGADIRLYYRNRWKYDPKRHYVYRNNQEKEVELLKYQNEEFYNRIDVEACCYNIDDIKTRMGNKTFDSLSFDDDNTEHWFSILYNNNDSKIYSLNNNWRHPIKIYSETICLDVEINGGYYEWEKAFHGKGEFAHSLSKYISLIKERAQLFGCKEIAIYPDGYDPTEEITNRLHWNVSDLKDYINNSQYLNDYDGRCGGDINKWRSNEKHIDFQDYQNANLRLSDDDFVSVVYGKVD